MDEFNHQLRERQIQDAVVQVRKILDQTKHPATASEVHHAYDDKFLLVNFMTNAAIASQISTLSALGLTPSHVSTLIEWAKQRSVSLRFRADEKCSFVKEVKRDVENPTKQVTDSSFFGSITSKVVTTVTEYFWKFDYSYEVTAYRGVGDKPDDTLMITGRSGSCEIKTSSKHNPRKEVKAPACLVDVDITWMIKQLSHGESVVTPQFSVDREHKKCATPRRNADVSAGLEYGSSMARFLLQASQYLLNDVFAISEHKKTSSFDSSSVSAAVDRVFVPVVALFDQQDDDDDELARREQLEEGEMKMEDDESSPAADVAGSSELTVTLGGSEEASSSSSVMFGVSDLNKILSEERRTLTVAFNDVGRAHASADSGALITSSDVQLLVGFGHIQSVLNRLHAGVDFVEQMLRDQLIAAIGNVITPKEFEEYMVFHNNKLFSAAFRPKPFCYAVRRSPVHSPEGTLSIEYVSKGDAAMKQSANTMVRYADHEHPMTFPLNAAVEITFNGDRYLHAMLQHQFSSSITNDLSLVAHARQFSSMIVMVGAISSATSFAPKYAAIVKNQDELTIPLSLSTIPTPKEFKDAIASLSPEQQRFAKAFRGMQLESTLFGILVIQIKPQLEKVLNLEPDALTKEIKLSQELMELFIEYQIPSDLLSFAAERNAEEASGREKLEAVKANVKAMREMIAESKKEEIEERKQEEYYSRPLTDRMRSLEQAEEVPKKRKKCKKNSAAPVNRQLASFASKPSSAASIQDSTPSTVRAPGAPNMKKSHQQLQEVGSTGGGSVDYTQIPKLLDARYEAFDTDSALRPTIIKVKEGEWSKKAKKALLAKPETKSLSLDQQKEEKDAAFDLLDALTRSGGLTVDHASLHVVIAATHCFDKTIMETVVQDNVSPIEKVERSELIMASTIHNEAVSNLLEGPQVARLRDVSPQVLGIEQP